MASLYQITEDITSIMNLFESAVDEDGNPRELNFEEFEFLKSELEKSMYGDLKPKLNAYGQFYKNLGMKADVAEATYKSLKSEQDRLSKIKTTCHNRQESLKSALRYCMDTLCEKKIETELFKFGIQNTQKYVKLLDGATADGVPEEWLKPREIDVTKIKKAIADGVLTVNETPNTAGYTHVYDKEGNELVNVRCVQGSTLVIR